MTTKSIKLTDKQQKMVKDSLIKHMDEIATRVKTAEDTQSTLAAASELGEVNSIIAAIDAPVKQRAPRKDKNTVGANTAPAKPNQNGGKKAA